MKVWYIVMELGYAYKVTFGSLYLLNIQSKTKFSVDQRPESQKLI